MLMLKKVVNCHWVLSLMQWRQLNLFFFCLNWLLKQSIRMCLCWFQKKDCTDLRNNSDLSFLNGKGNSKNLDGKSVSDDAIPNGKSVMRINAICFKSLSPAGCLPMQWPEISFSRKLPFLREGFQPNGEEMVYLAEPRL